MEYDHPNETAVLLRTLFACGNEQEMQYLVAEHRSQLTIEFFRAALRAIFHPDNPSESQPHKLSQLTVAAALRGRNCVREQRYDDAIPYLKFAAGAAGVLKNYAYRGNVLNEMATAHFLLDQFAQAAAVWEEVWKISEQLDDADARVDCALRLGNAYRKLSQLDRAVDYDRGAVELCEKEVAAAPSDQHEKWQRKLGLSLSSLGLSYNFNGNLDDAQKCVARALQIARRHGDHEAERDRLGKLGRILALQGKTEPALIEFARALESVANHPVDKSRDRRARMLINMSLGNVYREMNDGKNSRKFYRDALRTASELDDQLAVNRLLCSIGITLKDKGRLKAAQKCFEQSLQIARTAGDRLGEGDALGNLGNVRFVQGQFQKAAASYQEALAISREFEETEYLGRWTGNLGNVYVELGQIDKAEKHYRIALDLAKKVSDKERECLWHYNLGLLYKYQRGKLKKAYICFYKSIKCLFELKKEIRHDDHSRSYGERKVFVFQEMVETCLQLSERRHKALQFVELAKGYTLMRMLAEAEIGLSSAVPQPLREEYAHLQEQRRTLEKALVTPAGRADELAQEKHVQMIQLQRLLALRHRQAMLLAKAAEEDPALKDLTEIPRISLEMIQSQLRSFSDETVLVEFFVMRRKSVAIIVGKADGAFCTVELPALTEATLSDLVEKDWLKAYERLINDGTETALAAWRKKIDELGELLYANVWGPIEDHLNRLQARRIVLVPHLALHLLPLHLTKLPESEAVPANDKAGIHYLADRYEIVYAPSFRVLQHSRTATRRDRCRQSFFAISNPRSPAMKNKGMDLPYADIETQLIAAMFSSAATLHHTDARKQKVFELAPTADFVHLATHGRGATILKNPLDAGLMTAHEDASQLYNIMTCREIYQELRLPQGFAVVMSACETGMVQLDRGDEYVGLPAAFLHAGAPAVISSLWRVNDVSTSLLMYRWYHYVKKRGMAPGQALGLSQRWLRTRSREKIIRILKAVAARFQAQREKSANADMRELCDDAIMALADQVEVLRYAKDDFPFSHPFYWGAFFVSGNPE